MLSFATVHALTAYLCHVDRGAPLVPLSPPGHLGTLVLVQDRPIGPAQWHLRQARVLHLPLLDSRQRHETLPAALHHVADTITATEPPPAGPGPLHADHLDLLRRALHEQLPGLRLLAWAVCYDDVLVDTDNLTCVRRIDAVDVDGRVYQLNRLPGEAHPVVLVDEQPDPDQLPATHPGLVALAAAVTGHPVQS